MVGVVAGHAGAGRRPVVHRPGDRFQKIEDLQSALVEEGVRRHLDGRVVKKRVFVPDKLLNLVVD